MTDCIFCRIARGELPAQVVGGDDDWLAFHDLSPVAPTHILVVPRRHVESLAASSPGDVELLGRLVSAARDLAAELGLDHYRMVVNNGRSAGQSVFHLHLHLLGGRDFSWPPG
jgi:histidine triad (HIT) family protein